MVLPPDAASAPKRGRRASFSRRLRFRGGVARAGAEARAARARRPATVSCVSVGRLADDQAGTHRQEARRALRRGGRRAEARGRRRGRNPRGGRARGRGSRPGPRRPSICLPRRGSDRLPEEGTATLIGVEQHHRRIRKSAEQHQPRQSSAGPEVEYPACTRLSSVARSTAWSSWRLDRAGADEPSALRLVDRAQRDSCHVAGSARGAAPPGGAGPRPRTRWRLRRSRPRCRARPCGRRPTSARAASARRLSTTSAASSRVNSSSASRRFAR